MNTVASAVSKDLSDISKELIRMINTSSLCETLFSHFPTDLFLEAAGSETIARTITQRQNALTQARQALLDSRGRIVALACEVLNAHTACLDIGIRTLEQTIHGSVARGTRAQAEHLSTVAEGVGGKSQYVPSIRPIPSSQNFPFLLLNPR